MTPHDISTRLEKLSTYLAIDGDNFALLSEAADLCLQLRQWERAKRLLEKALSLQPNDAAARYGMAVVLLNERRAGEALAITQSLLDQGETHTAIRFEHARALAMTHRFTDAEPFLIELVREGAQINELPLLLIRTQHHLGKVDEAIAFAEAYVNEHPEVGAAQGMLGLLHFDKGNFSRAATLATAALERAPDNLDAIITTGLVALAHENADDAKVRFDRAIAIHETSGRAWLGLGLAEMQTANLPAARTSLKKAIACMPEHLGTYNALAWVQIMERDYEGAKATLEKALAKDRNFSETYGGLAVLASIGERWDEAERMAETAVRLQANSFSGRYAQSLIAAHKGSPERSQRLLESIYDNVDVPGGGNLKDAIRRFAQKGKSGV